MLPFWLRTVWRHLGGFGTPYILKVMKGQHVVGVAPLTLTGRTACFLGHPDVCDYQDIVTSPGQEMAAMDAVVRHLSAQGLGQLDLKTLHPDAVALRAIKTLAPQWPFDIRLTSEDVTYETVLPSSWDAYLRQLKGKQRHEVRRKLRRLEAHGLYSYHMIHGDEAMEGAVDTFLRLFLLNRSDKAEFMDSSMAAFFRDLIKELADHKMLRLYFLKIDGRAASAVLCFDYKGVRYLYNSGYDAQYRHLSVGILCKVLSIEKAIEAGCQSYDFLKGAEIYKKRIGGQKSQLYRCRIEL